MFSKIAVPVDSPTDKECLFLHIFTNIHNLKTQSLSVHPGRHVVICPCGTDLKRLNPDNGSEYCSSAFWSSYNFFGGGAGGCLLSLLLGFNQVVYIFLKTLSSCDAGIKWRGHGRRATSSEWLP